MKNPAKKRLKLFCALRDKVKDLLMIRFFVILAIFLSFSYAQAGGYKELLASPDIMSEIKTSSLVEHDPDEDHIVTFCKILFPDEMPVVRCHEALKSLITSEKSFEAVCKSFEVLFEATAKARRGKACAALHHDILLILAAQNKPVDELIPLAKILIKKARTLFKDVVSNGMVVSVAQAEWGLLPVVRSDEFHPQVSFEDISFIVNHYAVATHEISELSERIEAVMKAARALLSSFKYSFSEPYKLITLIDDLDLPPDAIENQIKAFEETVSKLRYELDIDGTLASYDRSNLCLAFLRCAITGEAFDKHIEHVREATKKLSEFPHLGTGWNAHNQRRVVKSQIFKVIFSSSWASEAVDDLNPYVEKLFTLNFKYFYPLVTFFFNTAIGHAQDLKEAQTYFDVFFNFAEGCKDKINFEYINKVCTSVETLEVYLWRLCG